MTDIVQLTTETDLYGNAIAASTYIDREPLTRALYAQLKDLTLEQFAELFINRFDAVVDYTNLCAGQKTGQRISLLFNPHRLDIRTKICPRESLFDAIKRENWCRNLARVVVLKKDTTKDVLYQAVGMGINGVSYVQEFPPHVARDLALEYNLSKTSKILDPCAGWGGRMLGFSTVVDSYTCCEPSTRTAVGLHQLLTFIQSFRSDFTATIHEQPFEDVQLQNGAYDFALTSPPYYDTEWYAPNETANSFNRYPTFDAWVNGFYAPLIHHTMAALKPDGVFVMNIGSRVYPLNDWLFRLANGRYHVEKQKGRLSASNGLGKDGEGETFYEVRNPAGTVVLVDVNDLTPPPTEPAAEPVAAAVEPSPPARHQVSALDFAFNLRQPDEPAAVSETPVDQPPTPVERSAADVLDEFAIRGHVITAHDGKLVITQSSQLTDDDRAVLRAHKPALLALVPAWTPPATVDATSLAQFLGTSSRIESNYLPDTPPDLTGIDQIVLNFATSGVDWAHGDRPVGVTVSTLDGQLVKFLPFAFVGGGNLDPTVVKEWLRREVRNKHITNANTRFDLHHSREWGVDLETQGNTFSDIQHTAAILDDHRRKFKLDDLATDFLPDNVPVDRLDETRHHQYHASEVDARERYTTQLVGQLREKLYPKIDEQDLRRVHDLEDQLIPVVAEMEKNGCLIDRSLLKQWCAETERIQQECLWEVAKEVDFQVNPDSSDDWMKLFTHFNIPIGGITGTGKASFTDRILKGVDNRFVQLVRKAGKIASLRSKFLVAYDHVIGDDRILRYQLHQLRVDDHGTVRGRFSASDKNIQQVMNKDTHLTSFGSMDYFVRKLVVAPADRLFLSLDAAQIEFRLFVHYADSERLLAEYRKNPDISFHRIAEGLVKPFRADMPYTKVKSMNFLFIYGGGKTHLGEYLEVSQETADQFYQIYHRAFPEVKKLQRKAEQLARSRGYVRSILGRRLYFPDPNTAYAALNAVIQPSAADIFKTKLVELHNERKWTDFTMRAPVHDEVIGDVADDEGARRVKEILNRQSFPQIKVPIKWDGGTGRSWADCKS